MKIEKWHFPDELLYDGNHQWVRFLKGTARTGLTDFGQGVRGDILYVQLPAVGARVKAGEAVASMETGKWVGRIYSPCDGTIAAVNTPLLEAPQRINEEPYGDGWIFEVREDAQGSRAELRQGEAFRAWLAEEAERYGLPTPQSVP
ncbi:MAG: glycine cleavage system protein H [Deltaproteobacteria bacterium]|nr:glycine cleavage system protein H [Deltaproteobacteria bacterium]